MKRPWLLAGVTDDVTHLSPDQIRRLFDLPATAADGPAAGGAASVDALAQERLNALLHDISTRQGTWFDEEMDKLDNWAEDKRAGLKADLKELDEQIKTLKKEIRQTGNLPDKLSLQCQARALETKRDEAWRAYDAAAKEIEIQKDSLLDQVEERLGQSVSDEELFAIRFQIT